MPFNRRVAYRGLLIVAAACCGCRQPPDPVPIIEEGRSLSTQAALVSVQPVNSGTAEVVVKLMYDIPSDDWRLNIQNTETGVSVTPSEPNEQRLDAFRLMSYRLTGLVAGQRYRLKLGFRFADRDTLTVERTYTHTLYNPWKRLAHLSITKGLFTGTLMNRNSNQPGGFVRLTRYVNDREWQSSAYNPRNTDWGPTSAPGLVPRRGLIEYDVYFMGVDRRSFIGLGYHSSDMIPGRYVYLRDLYSQRDIVIPSYEGEDGEVVVFTTTEAAFFLTNDGSPAMRRIQANWDQDVRAPLPEKPGILATFSLGETGYVINQVPGRQPHLFAYDSRKDTWTRKADFPGAPRLRGVGFSFGQKGYFGLGAAASQQGLRDLWQYDPLTDQWKYLTDYPGQGNRFVVACTTPDRVFLGFGYESQTVAGAAGTRLFGCTDFWEFKP